VVPGETPVTCPVVPTVATAAEVEVHVIGAAVIVTPAASFAVAVRVDGCPGTSVTAELESVSVAITGTVTVTVTVPDTAAFAELVARMVAVPPATAVTVADVPLPETVAMEGASDAHVMALLAPAGATVALTVPVLPAISASVPGATVMEVIDGIGGFVGPSPPPPHAPADTTRAATTTRVLASLKTVWQSANSDDGVMDEARSE
jgi:hypothetical protein